MTHMVHDSAHPFLAAMRAAIEHVEVDSPPPVIHAALDQIDARMSLPMGESFASPGAAGLKSDEGFALVDRLIAIVRSAPGDGHVGVRMGRLLRLAGRHSGRARVTPVYPSVTFRVPARGYEGTLGPPTSFGYSIYCHHTEIPLGRETTRLGDTEVMSRDRWVPWLEWCVEANERRFLVTCGRCGRDTLTQHARRCGRPAPLGEE